jgi:hypothetical protein
MRAATRHVIGDEGRMAGQVFAHEAAGGARITVVAATRRAADENGHILSRRIEGFRGLAEGGATCADQAAKCHGAGGEETTAKGSQGHHVNLLLNSFRYG